MGKVLKTYPPVETQGYGINGHLGVDLTGDQNGAHVLDWIVAFASGTVIEVRTDATGFEPNGSYGNYVLIDHGNGYRTRYAHMEHNTIKVAKGEKVTASQTLGYMGATGTAYGAHLHFEVILNGKHINPEDYVFRGKEFTNPTKYVGTPVARDKTKNQLEVIVDNLFVRENHSTNSNPLGFIKEGIYNYTDTFQDDKYTWYHVALGWIATDGTWLKIYPKEDDCNARIQALEQEIAKLKEQLQNQDYPVYIFEATKEDNYWIHLEKKDRLYFKRGE